MQEQIHRLRCEQLPIEGWRNWIELPHVIGPGEFNLQPSTPSVVTNAANLNIIHGLMCDVQWLDAVDTIAHPFPAAGAPVEVRIEMARRHLGRLNERLFQNRSPTVRALRWLLQNVIRHAGIGSCNAIENGIERNLGAFGIAFLAGLDQSLGFAKNYGIDEYDYLLLWQRRRPRKRLTESSKPVPKRPNPLHWSPTIQETARFLCRAFLC
jgi:hypothetical protein